MVNVRLKGIKGKELAAHLAELEEDFPVEASGEPVDLDAAHKEVAWLRNEVADLRERLTVMRGRTEGAPRQQPGSLSLINIAMAVTATFVLGKIVERLRL